MSTHRRLGIALCTITLLACEQVAQPTDQGSSADRELQFSQGSGAVAVATGSYRFFAPEEVFGVEIHGRFTFEARKYADGSVEGQYDYDEIYPDQTLTYRGTVTCFQVYDGSRAKIGGLIEESNDPLFPPGMFLWWSTKDNGDPTDDWSTFGGAGDEAANEAFCNSPNLPRFGPFLLQQGNSNVQLL